MHRTILAVVPILLLATPQIARCDQAADIKELQAQVRQLRLAALATQLVQLRHAVLFSNLAAPEKATYSDHLKADVESLHQSKPLEAKASAEIGDIIHAVDKAGIGTKGLKECQQKCDDAYDNQIKNCNNLSDPFDQAYCQNQAVEAWQTCQDDCKANNP